MTKCCCDADVRFGKVFFFFSLLEILHTSMITRSKPVKLPSIFLGAPLTFNGAPGNIMGSLERTVPYFVCTLQLTLRPCAMVTPDTSVIIEMFLFMAGFSQHTVWAGKLYVFFKTLKLQVRWSNGRLFHLSVECSFQLIMARCDNFWYFIVMT